VYPGGTLMKEKTILVSFNINPNGGTLQ
jgi:hypothetical protein